MDKLEELIRWVQKNKKYKDSYSYDPEEKCKYIVDYDDLLAKIIYLKNNSND